MEIRWISLVDLWQTCVLPRSIPDTQLMVIRILSRLREKHPLVSHRSALYSNTNLRPLAAPQLLRTSKRYAKQD